MLTRAWCIVMTSGMEHCDEKGTIAVCGKGTWIIVLTRVMELCSDKGHGAL